MAVLLNKCDSFYVLFIVLLGINTIFTFDDTYYYENQPLSLDTEDFPLEFKLIDNESKTYRQKRALPPQPITSLASFSTPPTNPVTSSGVSNATSPTTPQTVIKKLDNITIISNSAISDNNTSKTKNLGENGHGIRLTNLTIITSTTRPPAVQVVSNAPPSTKTSEMNISTTVYPFSFDDELESELDEGNLNQTLKNRNITTKTETTKYYKTDLTADPQVGHSYWVNMTNRPDVKVNALLSKSHRKASTVRLSFDFPFYGHMIKNVTIATGGFLFTGNYVHTWLAATQYIAPLMANFDTSLSNDSFIKYVDNGTAFTVEWDKVLLQDRPKAGPFTFQVTLLKNGDIIFVYAEIPVPIDDIKEHLHPVTVGLSDAYIMEQTMLLVRRKTIYEYERVHFNKTHISNWTSIYLKALPTCLDHHDCKSCLEHTNLTCKWCPSVQKCSEGYDHHRQEWAEKGCDNTSLTRAEIWRCDEIYSYKAASVREQDIHGTMNMVIAIIFLVGMACGISLWVFYAYRNPHTTSGQILIRYRPSQWRWRRGEARYTAATIHM